MRLTRPVPFGAIVALALLGLGPAAAVAQVALQPGDILVLNPFGSWSGDVVRVDPATGAQTVVSADGFFTDISALAIAPNGQIYVTDCGCAGTPSIIRVDGATGGQTVVSTAGFLDTPTGIAVDPSSGDLVVVDTGTLAVFRVDPATGAQTLVSQDGLLQDPRGIAIGPTGDFFVVDAFALAVFRIDPVTGGQTVVSTGQLFDTPLGIAVAASGTIFVADACSCAAVIAIDPAGPSGSNQTLVTSDGSLTEPLGIAIAADGTLVVADGGFFSTPAVIAVNPVNGAQAVVTSGGPPLVMPAGVAVVPGFAVTVTLVGSGTVTSEVPGIACPGDCAETYAGGSPVRLSATPAAGWLFAGWSGACGGAGSCDLFLVADAAVTATFRRQLGILTGAGGTPQVRRFAPAGAPTPTVFDAYDTLFAGGVFVAAADLDGDGSLDIVTGAGSGGGPHVRAFNGDGTARATSFYAYVPAFLGGARVAGCDFDGDGRAEIVTGAGPGGAAHVRVITLDAAGNPAGDLASFYAYDLGFLGGVFVACGDVDGDGVPDVIAGADAGGGPHVRVFSLVGGLHEVTGFYAFSPGFTGGVRVAAGNVDASDRASIVTGAGPGGSPAVRVVKWAGGVLADLANFLAYAWDGSASGGVFVGAGDVTGDGQADVITGVGAGGSQVRVFTGGGADTGVGFPAYDAAFAGGVRVSAGP